MGCSLSKPSVSHDTSAADVLSTCRLRMLGIEKSINHRQAFADAHVAYIESLRSVAFSLRKFAEGEISDLEPSPGTPSTPTLLIPESESRPSVAEPEPSPLPLSPPLTSSLAKVSPSVKPLSPQLSPIRLPTERSIFSRSSSSLSLPATSSPTGVGDNLSDDIASPPKYHEHSPPYYSPKRGDTDDDLASYQPLPPSSLIADSSWFSNNDIFTPPEIPQHLQEQRRMKTLNVHERSYRDDNNKLEELAGVPDQEEQVAGDEAATVDTENQVMEIIPDEVEKRVVSEEKLYISDGEVTKDAVDHSDIRNGKSIELEDADEQTSLSRDGHNYNNPEDDLVIQTITTEKEADIERRCQNLQSNTESSIVTNVKQRNLTEVVRHIGNLFARACKSGDDLSIMLETQMHYGFKDPSRHFNAITSYWSQKTPFLMQDIEDESTLTECGMTGSHISTLERLLAWEKKLCEEVKAGEVLQREFDQKCKRLKILDGQNGNQDMRDRITVALKRLDTQLMVAFRSIHVTSMKIRMLTDEDLYPQLCELLGGSVNMWKIMLECHKAQESIALELQSLENSVAENEISEVHKKATHDLKCDLKTWMNNFDDWMCFQREYVTDLFEWLVQCYKNEPVESRKRSASLLKDKDPIFWLLKEWRETIIDLKMRQSVFDGIKRFKTELDFLEENQNAELKIKKQVEKLTVLLKKLEGKYEKSRASGSLSKKLEGRMSRTRANLESETQRHLAASQVRKDKTLYLLQRNLTTVFKSLALFSEDAYKMYETVKKRAEASSIVDDRNDA